MSPNNRPLDTHVLEWFLQDLGYLLKERALQAKQERDTQTNTTAHAYHIGYVMAMLEVIALMQHQADIFGIPRELLRLDDIHPEPDLL